MNRPPKSGGAADPSQVPSRPLFAVPARWNGQEGYLHVSEVYNYASFKRDLGASTECTFTALRGRIAELATRNTLLAEVEMRCSGCRKWHPVGPCGTVAAAPRQADASPRSLPSPNPAPLRVRLREADFAPVAAPISAATGVVSSFPASNEVEKQATEAPETAGQVPAASILPLFPPESGEEKRKHEPGAPTGDAGEAPIVRRPVDAAGIDPHYRVYHCRGESRTLAGWARSSGVSRQTLERRLRAGWTLELAIDTPPRTDRGGAEKRARTADKRAEAVRLAKAGRNVSQIAREVQMGRSSIMRWLAEAGVKAVSGSPPAIVEHNGVRSRLSDWARTFGLSRNTLEGRLKSGWTFEAALRTDPSRPPPTKWAGRIVGSLRVIERARIGDGGGGAGRWTCQCDCGRTCTRSKAALKIAVRRVERGGIADCGHYQKQYGEHIRNHRSEYSTWTTMRASGAAVCARWSDFISFLDDVGPRPARGSVFLRPNKEAPFGPGNGQWGSRRGMLRASAALVEHDGRLMTLSAWAGSVGLRYSTLWARLHKGWTMEKALGTPAETNDMERGLRVAEQELQRRRHNRE